MDFYAEPLEVLEWEVDHNNAKEHCIDMDTHLQVHSAVEPKTRRKVGVIFLWVTRVFNTTGQGLNCLAKQAFLSDNILSATSEEIKEALSYSFKTFRSRFFKMAKKEGITIGLTYNIGENDVQAIMNLIHK